jgi:hypothetical protein
VALLGNYLSTMQYACHTIQSFAMLEVTPELQVVLSILKPLLGPIGLSWMSRYEHLAGYGQDVALETE